MKKIIITESQYKKLINITESGYNTVDQDAIKTFRNADIRTLTPNDKLMEEPNIENVNSSGSIGKKFDIKQNVQFSNPPTGNNRMTQIPKHKPINEDIFSPEVHQAVRELIENIWLNPSQKGLSTFFVKNGITWGELISYLTSVGIVAGVGGGIYKVTNFFKRAFSKDRKEAMREKMGDIEKMVSMIEKDPKAPWNQVEKQEEPSEETPFEIKQKLQRKPKSGWEAKPKPFNPNQHRPWANESEDEPEDASNVGDFTPIYKGKELAIFNGPDGMYVSEDSDNVDDITIGSGLKDFNRGINLVKIDEELKEELRKLYEKDEEFINILNRLEEMTSTGSVGGQFTGPLGAAGKPNISPDYKPAKQIEIINDEDEIYGKSIEETDSTSSGQYTGVKVWAKNKANWAAAHRTQYPEGEMVDFDPCTKLNNNKSAQSGKCSQGAVDKVVKTHKTKDSVISKGMYETIAKKTGRSIEDVKRIIELKIKK
jgi:hypothetical protein